MNIALVVILLVFGVLLLVAELFLLPGIGIAGIVGMLSLIASVIVAYTMIGITAGRITLAATIVLTALAIIWFIRSKTLQKMSLDTTIDSTVELAAPGKKIENLQSEAEKMNKE